MVSYSPFEDFKLNLDKTKLQDKQSYKYFGFRRENKNGDIGISRNLPAYNSAESIINAAFDDEKYSFIKGRAKKMETVKNAIKKAFDFDNILLEVEDPDFILSSDIVTKRINGKNYIPVYPGIGKLETKPGLMQACELYSGVLFEKMENL